VRERIASGSNRRRSTTVEERLMPSVKCAKPQVWNSGAAIIVFSRACSGMRESSVAAGSRERGWERLAPFGVPVVPEVRRMALPRDEGGFKSERSPSRTMSSSVRTARSPSGSCHATTRRRPSAASSRTSSNSSS
jgi:hypothetical protein